MKKVVVSVLLGFGLSILSTAPSEATDLYTIDQKYLPKISLAESDYKAALSKWKEIDQVKITNDSLGVSKIDVVFFNSRFGLSTITLSNQDQDRYPGPPKRILGKIISGTTACCAFGSIPGGRDSIYELIAPNFDAAYQEFNWDLEQEYSASIHMSTAAQAISAFQQGWMWSVKQDGTKVPFSEFETIRSLVKVSYANWQSLKNEYTKAQSDYFAEVDWIKSANIRLSLNFPTTVKNNLIKQGYFKPLKPFYYTAKTGNYIVSATQITENTFTVKAGPEYKKYKYTYTKKEQADWMKESQKLLDVAVKEYNSIIETAKFNGYVVICKPNVPCQISL